MACAVDASSPVRFSGTWATFAGGSIVSGSFTAPTDALLVMCAEYDTGNLAGTTVTSASDSGGLTWTRQVERTGQETTAGGGSVIFTARTTSAVSRTVTLAGAAATGSASWGAGRASVKLYVVTGADVNGTPVDTVTASNEGGSTTNNLTTTSLTPGATGLLFASDCDWSESGSFQASSDLTQDTTTYAGAISVCDGYKAVTNGVGATANLNAGGAAAAQHKWCQIIVREAAAAATTRRLAALGVG